MNENLTKFPRQISPFQIDTNPPETSSKASVDLPLPPLALRRKRRCHHLFNPQKIIEHAQQRSVSVLRPVFDVEGEASAIGAQGHMDAQVRKDPANARGFDVVVPQTFGGQSQPRNALLQLRRGQTISKAAMRQGAVSIAQAPRGD